MELWHWTFQHQCDTPLLCQLVSMPTQPRAHACAKSGCNADEQKRMLSLSTDRCSCHCLFVQRQYDAIYGGEGAFNECRAHSHSYYGLRTLHPHHHHTTPSLPHLTASSQLLPGRSHPLPRWSHHVVAHTPQALQLPLLRSVKLKNSLTTCVEQL